MSKRLICLLLISAMALSSCAGANDKALDTDADTTIGVIVEKPIELADDNELRTLTAANSENISASGTVAAYFFNDSYTQFITQMEYLVKKRGLDENKPLGEQKCDKTQTWLDFFNDMMRTYMSHYMALCEYAAVTGVELTDDELSALQKRAERGVKGKYGEGLSADDIFDAIKLEALANKLTLQKKAELMPTEEKMREYAKANKDDYNYPSSATVNVRHVLFSTDTYGSAEAALAKANEVMAGMDKADAEMMALLALEYSDDPTTCYIGGAYGNLLRGRTDVSFNDWCFDKSRTAGDIAIVETEYGAHIVYFEGEGLLRWQKELSEEMTENDFGMLCKAIYAKYPVTFDEKVIARIAK